MVTSVSRARTSAPPHRAHRGMRRARVKASRSAVSNPHRAAGASGARSDSSRAESLIMKRRLSEQVFSQYPGVLQTALAIFPGDGGKWSHLAVSDGAVTQCQTHKGIVSHLELARGHDKRIGDGKIQRTEFNT